MRSAGVAATTVIIGLAGVSLGQPAAYDIHRAGLYGPQYTSSTGTRNVTSLHLSVSGLLAGRSERFTGTTSRGFAAWLFEDGGTARIGYFDAAHTSSAGDQNSFILGINAQGTAAGTSIRYSGTQTGATAWTFRDGALTRLGYTDGLYTSPIGLQSSSIGAINSVGQVSGHSIEYVPTGGTVASPWLWDHGVYTPLGLTDAAHTRSDGFRSGSTVALNEAGDVVGLSGHYNGLVSLGTSAWVRRAGVTARVGLFGVANTGTDGSQYSGVLGITADGRAVGTSDEYPVGRFFRNSKAAVIYEGTREIHKLMQADYLLGYRTDRPTRCELPAYAGSEK